MKRLQKVHPFHNNVLCWWQKRTSSKLGIMSWMLTPARTDCLYLDFEKDLWTWSDKHSPVCENINGSVLTVPDDKKSILKLVPSTRRGAGIIMRRSSMAVASMTSDKLHHFLLTEISPGPLLGDTCAIHQKGKLFWPIDWKYVLYCYGIPTSLWIAAQVSGNGTLFISTMNSRNVYQACESGVTCYLWF